MPEVVKANWDDFTQSHPDAHILQTSAWGSLKKEFGWEPVYILNNLQDGNRIGVQLLFRKTPLALQIGYIPKGPPGWSSQSSNAVEIWSTLLPEIDQACKRRNTIFLLLEPDAWVEELRLPPPGFTQGNQSVQPPRTIVVDLTGGEEAVLSRMKQKTRYNIRLAEKKGVVGLPSSDIDTFFRLMETTGSRDRFGIHSLAYYQRAYNIFKKHQACELFITKYQDKPLTGIMVFKHGKRAWYFYGASSDIHRELMPSYLAQWQAICWAVQSGCEVYDLWGVPDEPEEVLEANFTHRQDALWGVYRFKRGFGGELRRSAGPFMRIYKPSLYRLYQLWLKAARKEQGE